MRKRVCIAAMLAIIMMVLGIVVLATSAHGDTTWSEQLVDDKAVLGFGPSDGVSIAVDSAGTPHLAYTDSENGYYMGGGQLDAYYTPEYLMYASRNGSGWNTEVVDNNGSVGYSALAFDSKNNPHIAYTVPDNIYPTSIFTLKYASWSGTSWRIQTVDTVNASILYFARSSLALDSAGYPHIAYSGTNGLMYASWNGLNWTIQTVDSAGSFGYVAVHANSYPCVVYQVGSVIKLATENSLGWTSETVVLNASSVGNLVLDSHGYPHFSYGWNDSIFLKSWNGSVWNTQPVAIGQFVVISTGYNRISFSSGFLALDSNDNPHLTFINASLDSHIIDYAILTDSSWDVQPVSPRNTLGAPAPLALNSNGTPSISYICLRFVGYYTTDGKVMYSTSNQTLPTPPSTPTSTPSPSVSEFPKYVALISFVTLSIIVAVSAGRKQFCHELRYC